MRKNTFLNKTSYSKKWRSGDACSTNPSTRKFRNEARKKLPFPSNIGPGLTALNLAKHNEKNEENYDDDFMLNEEKSSAQSHPKSSVYSSITGLTDCSNITFNKVQNLWASPVEEHKQICAVLAAVTEVIRAKQGNETEIEYFGALMVAVQASHDEDTRSAILFLLNLVIKRVQPSVLQDKFSEVAKILFELLAEYHQNGKTAMLKNLISCLSTLLLNQAPSMWIHSSTAQMFQSILNFCVYPKPKVRKSAQLAVGSLLKMNLINQKTNPTGDIAGKFCLRHLQQQREETSASTLHILNLLKNILCHFEAEFIRKITEEMLNLLRLGTVIMKTNCLQTLHGLFDACPPETNLSPSLNGQIISALYDLQPSICDTQLSPAWLKVMESAHANLSLNNSSQCLASLPKMFSSCMTYILSDSQGVASFVMDTMKVLVEKCLLPIFNVKGEEASSEQQSYFHQIFRNVELGLQYKYHSVWNVVLRLLALFFELFGRLYHRHMTKCLVTICDLHNIPKFPFLSDLEKTVAAAIKSIGPKVILTAVPLNLLRTDNKCEFPRSWLLPLMKDNIQNTELQYFISTLLPIAAQLHEKGLVCSQEGLTLEAKLYETLQQQIWALFPGFCKNPTDLKQAFKNIARILGKALTDKPEIRLIVLQSLRTMILKSADSEEDAAEIAKYGKNYLPILFNLYTSNAETNGDQLSLSVLETIRIYLKIADKELVLSLLQSAHQKFDDPSCSGDKRLAVMDLIAALVTHVDEKHVKNVFEAAIPLITADGKEQKKAYRILEEICQGKSDGCCDFVLENLNIVEDKLLNSISAAAPASKAPRLSCLTGMVRKLSANHKDFLKSILPEVILCVKATNAKAKVAAFNLLEEIGNCYIYFESTSKEDAVGNYLTLVMAGLTGSPNMISATLLSINRLVRRYRECLSSHLVESLLVSSVNLLRTKEREVTKSALALVKAIMTLLEKDDLADHSRSLIKNLFAGRRADRNFLRTQTQFVLEKLIRKLGYDIVRPLVPEDFRKFVGNINKIIEKRRQLRNGTEMPGTDRKNKHRKKDENVEDLLDDSLSEEVDESILGSLPGRNRLQKSEGWILERSGQVVDFLDSQMSANISASRPSMKFADAYKTACFPTATDGKLVIEEHTDGLAAEGNAQVKLGEITRNDERLTLRKRPRTDDNDEIEEFAYQPGGGGIHRPMTKTSRRSEEEISKPKFGAEYKAKKAGGDMKIKGKPDPFAYIPLNRQNLNKRKRARKSEQFKGVIKAAKRGVANMKAKKRPHTKK